MSLFVCDSFALPLGWAFQKLFHNSELTFFILFFFILCAFLSLFLLCLAAGLLRDVSTFVLSSSGCPELLFSLLYLVHFLASFMLCFLSLLLALLYLWHPLCPFFLSYPFFLSSFLYVRVIICFRCWSFANLDSSVAPGLGFPIYIGGRDLD